MLEDTWGATLINMGVALIVCVVFRRLESTHPHLSEQLVKIDIIWKIHMTLTTFILTFFVNQSYSLWRNVYETTRLLQGRINDLLMLATTHLRRQPPRPEGAATATAATAGNGGSGGVGGSSASGCGGSDGSSASGRSGGSDGSDGSDGSGGSGGAGAETCVGDVAADVDGGGATLDGNLWLAQFARYTRLWHLLFYASCSRKHACFCTDPGLQRLHRCGLLTEKELSLLEGFPGPPAHRHMVAFQWMVAWFLKGLEEDHFVQPAPLVTRMMEQFVALRHRHGTISDMVGGRTKLAYAHAVQLLVDVFLLLTPFALYSEVGFWSIAATGVLTTFYQGLFNLSKTFIDPLDNEDATIDSDCIIIDSLVKESSNMAGRWMQGALRFPF